MTGNRAELAVTKPERFIVQFHEDDPGVYSDEASEDETTTRLSNQELHTVLREVSVLPKEYVIQHQIVEQFVGAPEHISLADFSRLRTFTLNTGQTFTRGDKLGAGGQAMVYEAEREPLAVNSKGEAINMDSERKYTACVLKIIPVTELNDIRNIYREIVAWADKKNSNMGLVGVKHYITEQHKSFFVLAIERGYGTDLESRMEEENFAEQRKSSYFRLELMEGMLACLRELEFMSHAHQGVWIHGDIKPANVLLHGIFSSLLDWGIAYKKNDSTIDRSSGIVRGTPMYIAPDVLLSKIAMDQRNPDWYALGLTFAEALGSMTFFDNEFTQAQMIARIQTHGSVVVADQLTATTYHDQLKSKLALSPERDFAWLCYRLVQPQRLSGQFIPDYTSYADMINELSGIIIRQRLRLRAQKLHDDLEQYIVSRFQLRQTEIPPDVSKLILGIQTALTSDDNHAINEAVAKTKLYCKKNLQSFVYERSSIEKIQVKPENGDKQKARFESLRELVTDLIALLIKNYQPQQGQSREILNNYITHLHEGITLAERQFAADVPEVGFGILFLMQQDLSRLQLGQNSGQELQLRYYDYDALVREFTFTESQVSPEEESTTDKLTPS